MKQSMTTDSGDLYPMLFEPNLHEKVWGGHRLASWKQLPESSKPIGESWEVSAVPGSVGIISNGPFKGKDLISLINSNPEAVLGEKTSADYDGEMPLLVKFIDSDRDLSIQVHPDDEMARRVHGGRGKSEMWYVISAEPGAYLYAGFSKAVTPEECRKRIADGTITDVLARHEVHTGDVFYLPAGRVHAIGGGILLAEIQQSSDLTYRLYDYNRPGLDGKPRELHIDLATQALDYHVEQNYRTEYDARQGKASLVLDSPYFTVRVVDVDHLFHRDMRKYDSFVVTACLKGDCALKMRESGYGVTLHEGYSALIPAAVTDYDIIPVNDSGKSKVIEAFIDNKTTELHHRIARFLHLSAK